LAAGVEFKEGNKMTATQSQIRDALAELTDYECRPNGAPGNPLALSVAGCRTIRTILQSALDTQKPAGDAAEALDWFNGILDVFHSKYEATEPDKEAEHISTICAALAGKPKDGPVYTNAEFTINQHRQEIPVYDTLSGPVPDTADNAKRGDHDAS
jgi:hypothetical protein